MTCSIDGCDSPIKCREMCSRHYQRWRTYGDATFTMRTPPGLGDEIRFWRLVDKRGPDECWPWTGGLTKGYGAFSITPRRSTRAHRFGYELLVGPIPKGRDLDHTCHNGTGCLEGEECPHRRCCNPAHLEPTTPRENNLRGEGLAAQNAVKTHCPRGHAFDAANTWTDKNGWRYCRACARERARQLRAARRVR